MVTSHRIPKELHTAIHSSARTASLWEALTPIAQRDFVSWVTSAKKPETRAARIARVPSMLASGKKRPCCYALVPMSLYAEIGKHAIAKKQWSMLTPDERRDFVDWIESSGTADAHASNREDTRASRSRRTTCPMMLCADARMSTA